MRLIKKEKSSLLNIQKEISSLNMNTNFSTPSPPPSLLSALAIFQHYSNDEAIRSVHVYRGTKEGDKEIVTERQFLFSPSSYFELIFDSSFIESLVPPGDEKKPRFSARQSIGEWVCILTFDALAPQIPAYLPWILDLSVNPMLLSVPSLLNDLQKVVEAMRSAEMPSNLTTDKPPCSTGAALGKNLLFLDLNEPPLLTSADSPPSTNENAACQNLEANEQVSHGSNVLHVEDANSNKKPRVTTDGKRAAKPKKFDRASSSKVKSITRSDVERYFNMPLSKAAKNLGVGKSVLKKKCRAFGISVWPFRKINSINKLINVLEGEVKDLEEGNSNEAAQDAKELKRSLHLEKEAIEKSPNMKLQEKTIKFRREQYRKAFDARKNNTTVNSEL